MAQTTKPGQSELREWLAPRKTALVIIDMQVDFASPEGVLGKEGLDMSPALKACEKASRLADAARRVGAPVIFVGLSTRLQTDSPVWREWRRRMTGQNREDGICRADEKGSEFYEPKPQPGDQIVLKLRYSGFFGTSLDAALRAQKIDTLVVCGLTTECCVDCTVRDAFHLDYHVFIARDACAAYDTEIHETALKNLELNCAMLLDADAIITSAWEKAPERGART